MQNDKKSFVEAFDKSFVEALSEFNSLKENFLDEQGKLMKFAREVIINPQKYSEEDLFSARMFRNIYNSYYGCMSLDFDKNSVYDNMKVVASPAGAGKTRLLVEEAITMSEYGRVLYITHQDSSEHIKQLIYNNNINNNGNYENICISSCPQLLRLEQKDRLDWLVKSISDAINEYNFISVIIDDLSTIVGNSGIKDALSMLYSNFSKLQEIVISIQTAQNIDDRPELKGELLHMLLGVPVVLEIKKERITKENGDVYGQYDTLKNMGVSCTDYSSMFELYHYSGEFLIHRR